MKLAKDTFKKNEVEAAAAHIKDLIWEFIEERNLYASQNQYSRGTINLMEKSVNYHGHTPIANLKTFYKTQYQVFNSETNHSSHTLNFEYKLQENFYLTIFNKLNRYEKVLFIKTFSNQSSHNFFSKISNKLSEEDFWLHLRHVAPFLKGSQSTYDVRDVFNNLNNKSIDTEEKREALAYYIHYYKTICKRTDIQTSLKRLILKKIDDEHIPYFEQLLKIKISNDNQIENILEKTPQIETLIINKEKIFSEISFDHIPQAETQHYNRLINTLNKFLSNKEIREILGIERVDFVEFKSTKEPGRVFIQAEEDGFKKDITPIYLHLLTIGAKHFQLQENDEMTNVFEKSLNYYLLNQKIPRKNMDEEVTSKKSFKI